LSAVLRTNMHSLPAFLLSLYSLVGVYVGAAAAGEEGASKGAVPPPPPRHRLAGQAASVQLAASFTPPHRSHSPSSARCPLAMATSTR
jgi:hypothetical protein